jgi:radical SAM superfamily enzyme YgiQ (UPF0313 family)
MRVLLVNPGHDGEHAAHRSHRRVHRDPPPLGLLYIATALSRAGVGVDILDTHIEPEWMGKLAGYLAVNEYVWAGVSCIIGQRQRNADEVTRFIRERAPGLPVVWGGTMPTVMPEGIMETYRPDTVITGEGEAAAVRMCGLMPERGETVPDWRLYGAHYNREQVPYFHMIHTSRGCPMLCTFCYKHTATGGYRLMPLEDVKRQIETMHAETGSRVWTIGDDNFLGDGERALAILWWMKERGFYFEEVIGHVGQLTEEIAAAMAGVVSTFIFSVESASPRLQRMVKKGIALGAVPEKMGWLARAGVVANCSFIFGLPTETQAERDMNGELMLRIREANGMVRGVSYVYFPLPGTPMLETIERECGVSARFGVREYEDANFWPEDGDVGNRFRPWLSRAEYDDVVAQAVAFRREWAYPRPAPYRLDEVLNG